MMLRAEWIVGVAFVCAAVFSARGQECVGNDMDGFSFFTDVATGAGSGGNCSGGSGLGLAMSQGDLRRGVVPGAMGSDCSGGSGFIALQTCYYVVYKEKIGSAVGCVVPNQPPDCPPKVFARHELTTVFDQNGSGSVVRQKSNTQWSQHSKSCNGPTVYGYYGSGYHIGYCTYSYSSWPPSPPDMACLDSMSIWDLGNIDYYSCANLIDGSRVATAFTPGLSGQSRTTTTKFSDPWTDEELWSAAESCLVINGDLTDPPYEWRGRPAWALRKLQQDHMAVKIVRFHYRFVVKGMRGRSYQITYFLWEQNGQTGERVVTRHIYTHTASGQWELVPSQNGIQVDAPAFSVSCDQSGWSAKGISKPIFWKLL